MSASVCTNDVARLSGMGESKHDRGVGCWMDRIHLPQTKPEALRLDDLDDIYTHVGGHVLVLICWYCRSFFLLL